MTRKDYVFIASVVAKHRQNFGDLEADAIAIDFANRLARENPKFDKTRFIEATKKAK